MWEVESNKNKIFKSKLNTNKNLNATKKLTRQDFLSKLFRFYQVESFLLADQCIFSYSSLNFIRLALDNSERRSFAAASLEELHVIVNTIASSRFCTKTSVDKSSSATATHEKLQRASVPHYITLAGLVTATVNHRVNLHFVDPLISARKMLFSEFMKT